MGAETVRFSQEQAEMDEARKALGQHQERLRRLSEPEPPAQTLGNLALAYLFGGALAHGAVLPRTEAIMLESAVATTETADSLEKAA